MNAKENISTIGNEFIEKARLNLAKNLCLLLSVAFFIMSLIEVSVSITNFITYVFCTLFPLSLWFYLRKTKKYKPVYILLCFTGVLLAFYTLNNFTSEIHYGEFLWMLLVIILAFWGLGFKFGLIILILSLTNIVYYFLYNAKTNLTSLKEVNATTIGSLTIEVSFAFIAITIIVNQFIKNYTFSFQKISEANTKLIESNEIVSAKNKENTLLLKEVHHRVKNNLQIIVSLLRLQKNSNQNAQQNFDEAINRIMTMAIIHKKLYQSEDLTQVNLESYIQELIKEIQNSVGAENTVKVNIKVTLNSVGLKTIVPLGLMLNELLSNSYKHAFSKSQDGVITIEINALESPEFELLYTDNGSWKNSLNETKGFGLDLIDTLCQQLEGTFVRMESNYAFRLKNLDI